MAYRSDGTLLVGTAHGLRMLSTDGCPSSAMPLADVAIEALAVHPTKAQRVFAITVAPDSSPVLQRSDDGGESWTPGAALAMLPVTALVLDPSDPQKLYVSQTVAAEEASIAVSSDGGATLITFEQSRALTLLHAQASPARLWAMARVPMQAVGVTSSVPTCRPARGTRCSPSTSSAASRSIPATPT